MKIVMINGQNHKGSTYTIGKLLADKFGEDTEVVEFFLPRDLNHFCTGCYTCIEDDTKCPFYEEKNKIMTEVESADLLIFTTPTYCMNASAPLKAFIDLTFNYWIAHRPRACMFQKKAVIISTAAGSGAKKAADYVASVLFYWGVPYTISYGICIQAMNWDGVSDKKKQKIEKDITKIAKQISQKKEVKVGLKTKAFFMLMRMMQKGNMGSGETERNYWARNGWLDHARPW